MERFTKEISALIPDDMAADNLAEITTVVTGLLRQIKEFRIQKAAEHEAMQAAAEIEEGAGRRAGDNANSGQSTAKDRRSVEMLLDAYGIADVFPANRLLDKETGVHKDEHLVALQRAFGIPFEEMVFIDDKLNHLEVVARLGVRCGLAAWGYNGARETELARRAGHAVFELGSVESMLFG